ncbi:MAG TPA: peptide ABC transporter substrate-binding protein [Candidatus Nitrosotenuis sp.]|nr:peptide ABC transporter substrate-binding protein [Candidatus Nitrosotenuis sp.]
MEDPSQPHWRRFTKVRPNRKLMSKRARKIESATLKHAHTFIVRRWDNIKNVRRHALAWLLLMGLLIGISGLQMMTYQDSYNKVAASSGGTYAEGVTGPLETINPLFAATSAEKSANELIFSGLLGYDRDNKLRGDLADTWRIENNGARYVFDLKQNVRWHDGAPVTADDIVFTIDRIKNPLTRSALYNTWRNVDVKKISKYSVSFDLTAPYAPFAHALTLGIIPKHILNSVPPEAMREDNFNRSPVGTGAFVFNRLQLIDPDQARVVLYLSSNHEYLRGAPKLERFQMHVYKDREQVKQAFLTSEINAAADLASSDLKQIRVEKPDAQDSGSTIYDGTYALFRTDSDILQDVKVREALRFATDRKKVLGSINGYGKELEGPLLSDHYSSIASKKQPGFDIESAKKKLDEAGWVVKGDKRVKDGKDLRLIVVSPQSGDYPEILKATTANWRSLGITIETQLVPAETIQQNVLLPRAYDVLIYELEIGVDPDVYAYWHSSQAGPRGLNLSNYKSEAADEALTSAQSRSEDNLRRPKYESFVDTWIRDVPAVALFQPSLHYVTTGSSETLKQNTIVSDSIGRYRSIELWTIQTQTFYKTP